MKRAAWAIILLGTAPAMADAEAPNREPPSQVIARCQNLVRERPRDLEAYRCFWAAARNHQVWDEAVHALEAMLTIDPANQRARLYLAAIEGDRGRDRAEGLYVEAANGFQKTGEPTGEVYARLALTYFLQSRSRLEPAAAQLEQAQRAALGSGDVILRSRVLVAQASMCADREDYGRALRFLREAERMVFPSGPSDIQSYVLSSLGRVNWALGLRRQALSVYSREAELLRRTGDRFAVVGPQYNMALLAREMIESREIAREECVARVQQALDAALAANHKAVQVHARLLLAENLDGAPAIEQAQTALTAARQVGDRRRARAALNLLAERIGNGGQEQRREAFSLVNESIQDARSTGDTEDLARGLIVKVGLMRQSGDREHWIPGAGEALDAVEKIRDLQPEETIRARVFSQWAGFYHRFSGWLLEGLSGSPDPEKDLDLAFQIAERMRARTLLDELDAAGAHAPPDSADPLQRKRNEVLQALSERQKRLLSPSLPDEERRAILADLERLEAEEGGLRDELARLRPDFGRLRRPEIPTLRDLQTRLAADQAVLLFQVSTRTIAGSGRFDDGGSWLIVVAKDAARAIPLPDRDVIENQVAVFSGLFRRRDDTDAPAARELNRLLLAPALRELAEEVRRLVIVPDGVLNQVPFEALLSESGGGARVEDWEVSYAPSAALWLRWRAAERDAAPSRANVLALADPALPAVAEAPARRAAQEWIAGLQLTPLPHARREARALIRLGGRASRLANGPEASESCIKSAALGEYQILHFAAHAVVDDDHPGRSAIVLAAGAASEDGLLQPAEIARLDLRGKIVILSACRTASGSMLTGEGVLGLARAFFQAGARAVVGSLWPLRDDDAAEFMEALARRLGEGKSVAAALAAARRDRITDRAPTAAWAALVVLGDGDAVPFAGNATPGSWFGRPWVVAAIVLPAGAIVLAWWVVIRIRQRSPRNWLWTGWANRSHHDDEP